MGRPSKVEQRRRDFLPHIAEAFSEIGYRRLTTARLAERCGVAENVLYRIWPSKKAMFLESIELIYRATLDFWQSVLDDESKPGSPAERLLREQSKNHGHKGLYRIIYAGLSETDDAEIRAALRGLYQRFHRYLMRLIEDHRGEGADPSVSAEMAAWAIIGAGAILDLQRELGISSSAKRQRLLKEVGGVMLDGATKHSTRDCLNLNRGM